VYLPDERPREVAERVAEGRRLDGHEFVAWEDAPSPVDTTVTAMFIAGVTRAGITVECGSCGDMVESQKAHAVHCWEEHPWVPKPGQVRLENTSGDGTAD
jgi:hypothetical protein